jgi:hypothetical protein
MNPPAPACNESQAEALDPSTSRRPAPARTLWTVADVAAFAQCSERHVWNLVRAGLPVVRVGALTRFEANIVRKSFRAAGTKGTDIERQQQLADVAVTGDEDNAECSAADLPREFPNRT